MKTLTLTIAIITAAVLSLTAQGNIAKEGSIISNNYFVNPEKLNDGTLEETYLPGTTSGNGWIVLDLLQMYKVLDVAIRVDFGSYSGAGIELLASEDNASYLSIGYFDEAGTYELDVNTTYRYFKVVGTASNHPNSVAGVNELEIFVQHPIAFEYDAAGNRIKRNVVYLPVSILKSKFKSTGTEDAQPEDQQKQEEQEVVKDMIGEMTINIYPNPTTGRLRVEITGTETSADITVVDINGKEILKNTDFGTSGTVSLSEYASGTYIMRIDVGGEVSEWKVVKK